MVSQQQKKRFYGDCFSSTPQAIFLLHQINNKPEYQLCETQKNEYLLFYKKMLE